MTKEDAISKIDLALKDIKNLFKNNKSFNTISEDIKNILSKYFNNIDDVYNKIVFKGFNEKFNYHYYKISLDKYFENL